MAHHAYLSPDGKSVLVVQMDNRGEIIPCRIVPFDGSGEVREVGPAKGACLAGAWSKDGKWVYLSVMTDGGHIWRQRLSGGPAEQVTFGPTTQEGISMDPDGKSFVTSVGAQDSTVWMHDQDGDHQISSEGYAGRPTFSADGRRLYFLATAGPTGNWELMVKDLTEVDVEIVRRL